MAAFQFHLQWGELKSRAVGVDSHVVLGRRFSSEEEEEVLGGGRSFR
jgi:hypothetical protein